MARVLRKRSSISEEIRDKLDDIMKDETEALRDERAFYFIGNDILVAIENDLNDIIKQVNNLKDFKPDKKKIASCKNLQKKYLSEYKESMNAFFDSDITERFAYYYKVNNSERSIFLMMNVLNYLKELIFSDDKGYPLLVKMCELIRKRGFFDTKTQLNTIQRGLQVVKVRMIADLDKFFTVEGFESNESYKKQRDNKINKLLKQLAERVIEKKERKRYKRRRSMLLYDEKLKF